MPRSKHEERVCGNEQQRDGRPCLTDRACLDGIFVRKHEGSNQIIVINLG